MDDPVLVYSTFPDRASAQAAASALVADRLAACVTLLPGAVSIYRWEGAVEQAEEVVLLAKTRGTAVPALVDSIRAGHPYDLPAISVLPIIAGNPDFLAWIAAETEPAMEA